MIKAMAAPSATRTAMTIPAMAPSERPSFNAPSAEKTTGRLKIGSNVERECFNANSLKFKIHLGKL